MRFGDVIRAVRVRGGEVDGVWRAPGWWYQYLRDKGGLRTEPPPPPALFAYLDPLGFSVLGVGRETPGIEAPMAVFPEVSHMARVRFP